MKDRFKNISNNYAELFSEVFKEEGFDYRAFQLSIFKEISKIYPNYKDARILDIGIGDGETIAPFVKAGCKNLSGLDLNEQMLLASKKRFGDKVNLFKADATKMDMIKEWQFDIIITALCIHNIPTQKRKLFWKELLRINPLIFIAAEKIADPDPIKHAKYLKMDKAAIIKVYKERHNLPKVAKEWIDHYDYDETQKLTLDEIKEELSKYYNLKLVFDMGTNKTIIATRKK